MKKNNTSSLTKWNPTRYAEYVATLPQHPPENEPGACSVEGEFYALIDSAETVDELGTICLEQIAILARSSDEHEETVRDALSGWCAFDLEDVNKALERRKLIERAQTVYACSKDAWICDGVFEGNPKAPTNGEVDAAGNVVLTQAGAVVAIMDPTRGKRFSYISAWDQCRQLRQIECTRNVLVLLESLGYAEVPETDDYQHPVTGAVVDLWDCEHIASGLGFTRGYQLRAMPSVFTPEMLTAAIQLRLHRKEVEREDSALYHQWQARRRARENSGSEAAE